MQVARVVAMSIAASSTQLIALGLFAYAGSLSACTALCAMGFGSGLAMLGWLRLSLHAFRFDDVMSSNFLLKNWGLGRWIFASETTAVLSANVMPWLIVFLIGPAATGIFVACDSILRFANPVIISMTNVITSKAAIDYSNGGKAAVRRIVRNASAFLIVFQCAFCILLAIAGEPILKRSFGDAFATYWPVLAVLGLNQLVARALARPGRALMLVNRVNIFLWAEVAGLAISLVAAIILTPRYGVLGAAWSLVAGNVLLIAWTVGAYFAVMRDDKRGEPLLIRPVLSFSSGGRRCFRMKLLVCHEFYRQFGGEDQSFLDEVSMLRSKGHEVVEYTRHYDEIARSSRIGTAIRSVWNAGAYRELRSIIQRERPDLLHCTNLFPLISPAAYDAAHDEDVPVVQALRNYRLVCPSATLVRNGELCELCLGKVVPWPAVRYGCYQKSRLGSAVVATTFGIHNVKRTWQQVDCFYTPSHFARSVFIRAGIPAEQIEVKPNSVVPDPGVGPGDGGYALFVGRLAPEKGIGTLLKAWAELEIDLPLHIVGDGVCRDLVEAAAAQDARKSSSSAKCHIMPYWSSCAPRHVL